MDSLFPFVAAFLAGLLGGVHCVGMCGGIVSALSLSLSPSQRDNMTLMLYFQLAYNLGRVSSYIVAGALMGAFGLLLATYLPIYYVQKFLLIISSIFMILLGFYLSGWYMLLAKVESLGGCIWRFFEPMASRFLPVDSVFKAFKVGLFWGWVPCGLVYSMLINAMTMGSVWKGALLMAVFALGTLPNLLLMGLFVGFIARLSASLLFRRVSGSILILFGLLGFYRIL